MSRMKYALPLAAALAALAGPANAAELGTYTRPSTGTTVRFYDCGGNLCGEIVGVTDQARKSTIGQMIVKGAAPAGANAWKGDLYDPDSGKTYKGEITLESGGLKLQGCVLSVLCSSEVWKKSG